MKICSNIGIFTEVQLYKAALRDALLPLFFRQQRTIAGEDSALEDDERLCGTPGGI